MNRNDGNNYQGYGKDWIKTKIFYVLRNEVNDWK